jgi:hypothetical protein
MRLYTLTGLIASVTAAKDLIRLTAAGTRSIILVRSSFTQDTSETSEQLPVSLYRATTAGTGTAATAQPHTPGDPAFGGSAVVDLTADTTKSPATPIWSESQNVLGGWLYQPALEERPELPGAGIFAWRLETAPAAALPIRYHITFLEVG